MKYCERCGNRLEDSARFCESCGAKQPDPAVPASSVPDTIPSPAPAATTVTSPSRRRLFVIVGVVVAIVLAVCVGVGAALVVNHANRPVQTASNVKTGASGKDAAKSGGSADSTGGAEKTPSTTTTPGKSKSYSAAEARDMIRKNGDYSAVAGTYCMTDGVSCLTIDAKGVMSQPASSPHAIGVTDRNRTRLHPDNQWGEEISAAVELAGSEWHCPQGGTTYDECVAKGASDADFDARPPDLFWIPANTPLSSLEGMAAASMSGANVDTSRTWIYKAASQMNSAPDEAYNVYYKQ